MLAAVDVPLIVYGPGTADKDNEVLVAVAERTKGEQLALGLCEEKNYRTIVAAALGNGHLVIAQTPIDVNLAKQLNILISDMGLPLERVLMDPNTGALGYGLEYTYSVMERLRLAALMGDAMTQQPMICTRRRGGVAPEGRSRRERRARGLGRARRAWRGLGGLHGHHAPGGRRRRARRSVIPARSRPCGKPSTTS